VAATVDVKRWMKRRSRRVYYFIYLLFYGPGWMKTDMRPFACALSRPHARLHLSQMHTQTQMRTDMVTPLSQSQCSDIHAHTHSHSHMQIPGTTARQLQALQARAQTQTGEEEEKCLEEEEGAREREREREREGEREREREREKFY
jgi:hypothetical protein